ncbi:hypothetical protein EHS86_11785 [Erwinia amylovora]|nr:hypothetical protein AD997_12580 [Erwinia amylovora]CBJ47127.1 hypothetical protein EAM_2453 [Erwinia amylovora ATCC 49946]CCO86986.1 hypothetical protein BN434_2615 [Erwinia amylovora CFBP 2585]GAJ89346.1 hypothetical protein EAM01S_12_00590 [Erwinia amylovora NBRC 12687 = CFBP 1232]RUT15410.1 hypothetical protein BEI72_12180 [Erwinia amylovora]
MQGHNGGRDVQDRRSGFSTVMLHQQAGVASNPVSLWQINVKLHLFRAAPADRFITVVTHFPRRFTMIHGVT